MVRRINEDLLPSVKEPIIQAVLQKADQLMRDAQLLVEAGSLSSALSLTVLSIEESCKACLILWKKEKILKEERLDKFILSHEHKQRVYSSYIVARAVLNQVQTDFNDLYAGRVPYLALDELQQKVARADLSKAHREAFVIDLGFHDLLKKVGFYTEIDLEADLMILPLVCTKEYANQAIGEARRALSMVNEPHEVHAASAAVYAQRTFLKFGQDRKKKLREFVELVQKFADENADRKARALTNNK